VHIKTSPPAFSALLGFAGFFQWFHDRVPSGRIGWFWGFAFRGRRLPVLDPLAPAGDPDGLGRMQDAIQDRRGRRDISNQLAPLLVLDGNAAPDGWSAFSNN
jgi:hypothetical protein